MILMRLSPTMKSLLRQAWANNGCHVPKEKHGTARALERRGLVTILTHDDEGYECWYMDTTEAGNREVRRLQKRWGSAK